VNIKKITALCLFFNAAMKTKCFEVVDGTDCPVRVFITGGGEQIAITTKPLYILCTGCDFKQISELYSSHFMKGRYLCEAV